MKKLLLSAFLLFTVTIIFAQKQYTIKIVDAKTGSPVENASAQVAATKKGATTNAAGTLTIQAKEGDEVIISSVGYTNKTLQLGSMNDIEVLLEAAQQDLVDVVVLGTRGTPRAKTETAVPIDVIKINQVGQPTAKMDLTSVLNMAAPSFNYNKQSGADGADHVDLGTLRGLGPDQTLVLINGKRRHTTALVALFGTRGRGASGTDLNAFPQSAVDRIEILRDGASAQYGSDAMAGVINIILKKDINHWTINTGLAGYYDTKFNAANFNAGNQYVSSNKIDGQTFTFSATNGFNVGNNGGFVSFALDVLTQGKTYRQVDTANWKTNKDALPFINKGRRAFGDGSVNTFGASYNMELPIKNSRSTFYSFGTVNNKESDAYAYSRNFSAKPERFPVTLGGALIFVPGIMQRTNDGETYYNPHIGTNINDASIALGLKGTTARNWNWDASVTTGKNDFQFNGSGTFNASSQGNTTKTRFDDGGFRFRQATVNLDFSKSFKTIANGLNIGYGLEYRSEKYTINKGEDASWKGYYADEIVFPNQIGNTPPDSSRALATGSQGFPGFSPTDTITAKRDNFSAYLDAELNISKAWLVDVAVRGEKYSDFGNVLTYKLATRIKAADNFNIRGSVSTGFRAPSLAQINFSNTITSFSSGQLVQSRIANNADAITKSLGIPNLKQETSFNSSLGFAWKPMKGLTVTIDGYMVKVKDRVVLSGLFSNDPSLPISFNNQLDRLGVTTAQFFTNAVNTTNYGLDIVLDYTKRWGSKSLKLLLAGNIQNLTLDAINVPAALNTNDANRKNFYGDRDIAFLKASAPPSKFNLSAEYGLKKFSFGTHITTFGKIQLLGFGDVSSDANPSVTVPEIYNYNAKVVTDLFASYKFSKKISFFIGADNIFNIHSELGINPLAKSAAGDTENGGPWDSVQMGFNGRKLFSKLVLNF